MNAVPDLALHLRLLAEDPTAAGDCIERWLPELIRHLAIRNPQVAATDEHLLATAAIDALLDYTQRPHKYDPQRSQLRGYLLMLAQGDLRNELDRIRRWRKKVVPIEPVELTLPDRNSNFEGVVDTKIDAQEVLESVLQKIDEPMNRRILALMLHGERATSEYAQALGIQNLPEKEQRAIVKRHKDRIGRRLERLGEAIRERE